MHIKDNITKKSTALCVWFTKHKERRNRVNKCLDFNCHKMHPSIETKTKKVPSASLIIVPVEPRFNSSPSYVLLKRKGAGGDSFGKIGSRRPGVCKATTHVPASIPSSLHVWTSAAQNRAANHENHRRRPSQVNRLTQLSLVLEGNTGVVEVLHHSVCSPRNRD